MAVGQQSFPISHQRLREAKYASVRENLRPLTTALAALFAVLAAVKFLLGREEGIALVLWEAGPATAILAIRLAVGRWRVPDRLVYPLLLLVEVIALGPTVAQMYLLGRPHDSTNFGLVILATGVLSLSVGWSVLCVGLVWGSWLYIAVVVHSSDLSLHYGLFLLWVTALAAVAQTARTRLLRRLIQTEAHSRERLEELVAQRTRQLEESLEQLRHSERLASVGTLAAGIAHQINNPVGMMLLSAEELRVHMKPDEDAVPTRHLDEIIDNAKRCGQIVKSVLRFARHQPAQRAPGDVNDVVSNAVSYSRAYAAGRGGVIHTALAADLPHILLNRVELEQALLNLIRNGIEAAVEAPRIAITTQRTADAVRVTVADNGRGIHTDDRRHVFDPFFTTRQKEGGTGLGLSLAYAIVTDHGGAIRVETSDAGGTTMIVDLPVQAGIENPPHPSEPA